MYKKITAILISGVLLFSACKTNSTVPDPNPVTESSKLVSQTSSLSSEPASIAEENKKIPDAETVSAYLMEEESLGGIKLGMTEQEAIAILGNPLKTSNGEFEGEYGYIYSSYFYDGLSVGLVDKGNGKIVNNIRVSRNHPAETSRGIKIGNTKSDVKEIYADIIDPSLFPSESMWDLGLRFHGLRFYFEQHPTKGIYITGIELGDLIPDDSNFECTIP